MPAASLRALLAHSIDYAGLFPPASLTLEPALRNHAEYVRTPDAWMLGAFILPLAKFNDAAPGLSQFDLEHRVRVSALGQKTENAADFMSASQTTKKAIELFNRQHGASAAIEQFEMLLPAEVGAGMLTQVHALLAELQLATFWEAPVDAAEQTIALLAEQNAAAGGTHGFKLRTGGVIASAFPSSVQIARALVAAAKHRVPIKFTAGLHHPVRRFHSSVQAIMHGFLNVLGAGVLGVEHKWDVQQAAAMLKDESADSFAFDDASFRWRDWSITTEQIQARRSLITSLGSCSFDEPRDDLRTLGLF